MVAVFKGEWQKGREGKSREVVRRKKAVIGCPSSRHHIYRVIACMLQTSDFDSSSSSKLVTEVSALLKTMERM